MRSSTATDCWWMRKKRIRNTKDVVDDRLDEARKALHRGQYHEARVAAKLFIGEVWNLECLESVLHEEDLKKIDSKHRAMNRT